MTIPACTMPDINGHNEDCIVLDVVFITTTNCSCNMRMYLISSEMY